MHGNFKAFRNKRPPRQISHQQYTHFLSFVNLAHFQMLLKCSVMIVTFLFVFSVKKNIFKYFLNNYWRLNCSSNMYLLLMHC